MYNMYWYRRYISSRIHQVQLVWSRRLNMHKKLHALLVSWCGVSAFPQWSLCKFPFPQETRCQDSSTIRSSMGRLACHGSFPPPNPTMPRFQKGYNSWCFRICWHRASIGSSCIRGDQFMKHQPYQPFDIFDSQLLKWYSGPIVWANNSLNKIPVGTPLLQICIHKYCKYTCTTISVFLLGSRRALDIFVTSDSPLNMQPNSAKTVLTEENAAPSRYLTLGVPY